MNKRALLIACLVVVTAIFFISNCKAEKDKDFFGIGEEDMSLLLTGIILNNGLIDTKDGNIIDPANGTVYRKCIAGQVYRRAENDCRGIQRGSLFTPNDVILFGATKLGYCDINSWNCNAKTFPYQLIGSTTVEIGGVTIVSRSDAFNYCNGLNTNNESGWRVATPLELKRLTLGGRNAMLQMFFDTPEYWFWSGMARADDLEGNTAIAVSFERSNFGEEKALDKRDGRYVRCVRGVSGR